MAVGQKKNKIKTYSSSLPEDLKDKVVKIYARHGTEFMTSRFITKEERDKQDIEWLEAVMDPDHYSWSVREYKQTETLIIDENDKVKTEPVLKQSTVLSEVSFFDALHCLAKFEAAEKTGALNRSQIKNNDNDSGFSPHFKSFAENEGLLFDKQSQLPIAVYNGVILDDECTIDVNAKHLIKRSVGNILKGQVDNKAHNNDTPASKKSELVPTKNKDIVPALQYSIDQANSQGGLEQAANKRTKKLKKMSSSFDLVAAKNGSSAAVKFDKDITGVGYFITISGLPVAISSFLTSSPDTSFGLMVTAAVLAGVGAFFTGFASLLESENPLDAYKDNGFAFPARSLRKHVSRCRKEAQKVNSQSLSDAYNKAADTAELAIYKLNTRHHFKNASKGKGLFTQHRLNASFRKLVSVATKQDYNAKEIEAMINEIKEDPYRGNYKRNVISDMQNDLRDLERAIDIYKDEQIRNLKALPSP
jgi:hypothetical protein